MKETIEQLPAFIDVAHQIGVKEVHLQRLVYFPEGQGMARPTSSLFESIDAAERIYLERAKTRAQELGVFFDASGASEPEESLTRDVERQALVDVPQALVVDVFHGPWPGAPLLHRALLHARL